MDIAREILEKHLSKDLDIKSYLRTSPLTYQVILDAMEEAINYTHCCESDSEQLFCGCGKNKPVIREPAYLHCDWCGSITVETK